VNEEIIISVILPSRQREEHLRRSLSSLRDNAHHPERVEFWVAIDPDDQVPNIGWVNFQVAPYRYGYNNLHHYYNDLSKLARGEWLYLWNDDATMLTAGWDDAIAAEPTASGVLYTPIVPDPREGNVFPVVPASWIRYLGHFSLHSSNDWWVCDLAKAVGRYGVDLPVEVVHTRISDKVLQERSVPHSFNAAATQELLRRDVKKLSNFLSEIEENKL
jgi:hypothetical protein